MKVVRKKKIILGIGLSLLPLVVVEAAFLRSNLSFNPSRADTPHSTLDNTQRPTLSGGAGTMVDSKNVTWEYFNAVDNPSGHISLGHQGYFGVASNSQWGYTSITSVAVSFTAGSLGELWLLKSANGIDWHEAALLKEANDASSSSATSAKANNWRYIRFYFYDATGNETIDINSVSLNYNCDSDLSGTEQVDSARVENVTSTTGLKYEKETSSLSPKSIEGEAVRFTKTGGGSTNLTIKLDKTYTLGEVVNCKVEFDIWTTNIQYGKQIQLIDTNSSYASTAITAASGLHSANPMDTYVWTSLGNDWYHAELPFTQFYTDISGYNDNDLPQSSNANRTFNAIKINAGNCVMDNLRIGSSPCELGNYNSTSYTPTANSDLWIKTSFAGTIHANECEITFSGTATATHITQDDPKLNHGSPFYIHIDTAGQLVVNVEVVCSYDHRTITITRTFTVN